MVAVEIGRRYKLAPLGRSHRVEDTLLEGAVTISVEYGHAGLGVRRPPVDGSSQVSPAVPVEVFRDHPRCAARVLVVIDRRIERSIAVAQHDGQSAGGQRNVELPIVAGEIAGCDGSGRRSGVEAIGGESAVAIAKENVRLIPGALKSGDHNVKLVVAIEVSGGNGVTEYAVRYRDGSDGRPERAIAIAGKHLDAVADNSLRTDSLQVSDVDNAVAGEVAEGNHLGFGGRGVGDRRLEGSVTVPEHDVNFVSPAHDAKD